MNIALTIAVGADGGGHPTVNAHTCSTNIGNINVDFHGGASWLYNLFAGQIAGMVKKNLDSQLCSAAKQAINDQGNKALASLPVVEKIDSTAEINFMLLSPPTFSPSYMDTYHKGEFFWIKRPTEAPFSPAPIPASSDTSRMLFLWITDYVANTAGYVYTEADVLKYTVHANQIPSWSPVKLNTTSWRVLLPNLYRTYPNMLMQLDLSATLAPTLKTTPAGLAITIFGLCRVSAVLPNGTVATAFILNAVRACWRWRARDAPGGLARTLSHADAVQTVNASGRVWVTPKGKQELIMANATFISTAFDVTESRIGPIDAQNLTAVVNLLCQYAVIPLLNSFANQGVPIPLVDGVSFVNPAITLANGYIEVSTDFLYKPTQAPVLAGRPSPVRML